MSDYYRGQDSYRPAAVDDESKIKLWAERRAKREKLYQEPMSGIWGDSPDEAEILDDLAEFLKKGTEKKKSKRAATPADSSSSSSGSSDDSSSDSSDSEEERRQKKKRKAKKKSKSKSRSKKSKKSTKKRSKRRRQDSSSSDDSDSDSSSASEAGQGAMTEQWVVAPPKMAEDNEVGGVVIGPEAPKQQQQFNSSTTDFGHALLPGEGDAMANYVAEGKRIPRRGEIGLTSEQISAFEDAGYVMSGSRHRRMEAVRLRKENQIYSADERRALAMFHYEEHQKKENKILGDFRELLSQSKKKPTD
eukprot:m.198971 g.198971  ORF g.198971 m.198971 type:complete len:304 (+) comp18769_c0_seq2:168-1079(+)